MANLEVENDCSRLREIVNEVKLRLIQEILKMGSYEALEAYELISEVKVQDE